MSHLINLDDAYALLNSGKATDRSKALTRMLELLTEHKIVKRINKDDPFSWSLLLEATQICLKKETDKFVEESHKKGTKTTNKNLELCKELFVNVVNTSISEGEEKINVSKLVRYISGCLKDRSMKICNHDFIMVIKNSILSNQNCLGTLNADDFELLFGLLKSSYAISSQDLSKDLNLYRSFLLLFKYGPLTALSPHFLREQFCFVSKLCQKVNRNSSRNIQEDVMELILEFCKHTVEDNRMSCVKLGEEVFPSLLDLYLCNGQDSQLKVNFIEWCLLQVTIHTPNGVTEGHPNAQASNWRTWKSCIRRLYSLLSNEVSQYLMAGVKNKLFFIPQANKTTVILDSFVKLFVEVSNQMFSDGEVLNSSTSFSLDMTSQSQKRRRVDANMESYFDEIRETKSWVWVKLVGSLIYTYPNLIDERSFLSLLQILQTSQLDETNSINNIYECQAVLLGIQSKIVIEHHKIEVQNLWSLVGEATLRAVGLNQNIKTAQELLQKLIQNNMVDLGSVLQTYNSNVIFTDDSLNTLETTILHINYSQLEAVKKKELFSCLINSKGITGYKHLLTPKFSKIVVTLMLKQCPLTEEAPESSLEKITYRDLTELYTKSTYDCDSLRIRESQKSKFKEVERSYNVDTEVCHIFLEEIQNFVQLFTKENLEKRLSVFCFLYHLISDLVCYGIVDLEDVPKHELFTFFKTELKDQNLIESIKKYKSKNELKLKEFLEIVHVLDALFSIKNVVTDVMKKEIPMELLTSIFEIFNHLDEGKKKLAELEHIVKKSLIQTLSKYCFISNSSTGAKAQYLLMGALSKPDYDYSSDTDYKLSLTFLNHVTLANPGSIPEEVISNILDCIKRISQVRFRSHYGALDILLVLKDIYPHLAVIQNDDLKDLSVRMLNVFYTRFHCYGPDVSLAILECIQTLCQVDPRFQFSHWDGEEIIKKVPVFLSSDFQKVRFRAIEILVDFFISTSKSKSLRDFHRQEEIFSTMYEMSIKVFEVEGELTEERRKDEILFRTVSVFQTFLTLMTCCNSWLEESLMALIKLEHHKKIGLVDKIYSILKKHLKNEFYMEKYLEGLIGKWVNAGYSINDFEFKFFNCTNKIDMYVKFFDVCLPLLLRRDRNDLFKAAKQLNLSEKEVFEKFCTKIFGRCLASDIDYVGDSFLEKSVEVSFMNQVLKDRLFEILKESLDRLIISLLNSLTDEKLIFENFGENVIFTSKGISFRQFQICLKYVEDLLCDGESIIKKFYSGNLYKIQIILLELQSFIYDALADEQLKSYHRYTVFLDLIVKNLKEIPTIIPFFLRDTIYFNINLIKNNLENEKICLATAKFFNSFIRQIVPNFAKQFKEFLTFTVNSLKNFAIANQYISKTCIDTLEYLLVENAKFLVTAIQTLDAFPQSKEFENIRKIHNNIKYGNKEVTLEDEIKYFLDYNDIATRQDSLVHLRKILSKEKTQLKSMFEKLELIRGFSEDCENSILHQLISMLVKMSCYPNQDLNFEAIRCLGELGPANLMTLVLKPEGTAKGLGYNAILLMTGAVVTLLSQYIVDSDINVVINASNALCQILQSKDERKVIDSPFDFGFGEIKKDYILPYIGTKNIKADKVKIDLEHFSIAVNDRNIWCPSNVTCNQWVTSLVAAILGTFDDGCFLRKLIPVCNVKPKFCELILPLLIHLLLHINKNLINDILSIQINEFFSRHWQMTVTTKTEQDSIPVDKRAVKCMLDVLNFVRQQYSASNRSGVLTLNYLPIAKAAAFCSAHFTALMYAELWCRQKMFEIEQSDPKYSAPLEDGYTILDVIYENSTEEIGITLQGVLRGAYVAIGDTNALSGCGITLLLRPEFRVEHQKNLGQWSQAMLYYSMEAVHQPSYSTYNCLVESFKKNELYELALLYDDLTEPQYECLWRLGKWTIGKNDKVRPADTQRIDHSCYEKYKFDCLKALRDKDKYCFTESKKKLSLTIIENLKHLSLEGSKNLYPVLSQLQSLVEMEDFSNSLEKQSFEDLMTKWDAQDLVVRKNDFQYVEPISAQRWTILNEFYQEYDQLRNCLVQTSLRFADYARREGHILTASRTIEKLQKIPDLTDDIKNELQFREAQLSWVNNDKVIAKHILRRLCKSDNISPRLKANALKLQGDYMIETYADRSAVLTRYFDSFNLMKSINQSITLEDHQNIQDTFDKLATFADQEYQQIMSHIKSDVFQKKVKNMKESREMARTMGQSNPKQMTADERRAQTFYLKYSNIDEAEINNTKYEKDKTLMIAIKFYLKSLILSDRNNIKIFRLMSLFLENRENTKSDEIITKFIDSVPSYKYVTMLPQLVPHICDNPSDLFGKKINDIIEKCAREHPHHTLPLLLALANADKDKEYSKSKIRRSTNEKNTTSDNILNKLKDDKKLTDIVTKMQLVSEALIELAYHESESSGRKNGIEMSKKLKIHKIKNFNNVLVPTYTLPVSKTNSYENIVGISKFETTYVMVGGINAPKRINCITTTGENHSQLVKGQDDLRQDAVMQQVFTIMNDLLSSNKQTRNLLIRTYKIVPLSMRSGILKWADNSMPIGEFLTGENGSSGAHNQFRPKDISANECRNLYKKCQTSERKLTVFKEICKRFKPVMHKFFETYFPQATVWYERRRAYIHSVATTSMCGYILGIGDRHVSNILIDKRTAEVIHIDFGISFEQGKCLPTPETVPFRLSRDIVDGMGVSGIEGIFRSACEHTMEVLRSNSQTILTILEVLLYDPLYYWTVTPAEAEKRQTDENFFKRDEESEEENKNVSAERALLRLRSKLQGMEEGKPTSVEQQVGALIQQAVDPVNLSKLFHGWQPWL